MSWNVTHVTHHQRLATSTHNFNLFWCSADVQHANSIQEGLLRALISVDSAVAQIPIEISKIEKHPEYRYGEKEQQYHSIILTNNNDWIINNNNNNYNIHNQNNDDNSNINTNNTK